ncbi:hypothetical protein ACVRW4_07075 [Streptococcus phocae subsp. phocae]
MSQTIIPLKFPQSHHFDKKRKNESSVKIRFENGKMTCTNTENEVEVLIAEQVNWHMESFSFGIIKKNIKGKAMSLQDKIIESLTKPLKKFLMS